MYRVKCLRTGFRDSGLLQSCATAPQGEDSIGLFSSKRFGDGLESRDLWVEVRRYVCACAGDLARVSASGFLDFGCFHISHSTCSSAVVLDSAMCRHTRYHMKKAEKKNASYHPNGAMPCLTSEP